MGLFVGFVIFMIVAFVVAANGNRNNSSAGWQGSFGTGGVGSLASGTPARGIMLQVSSTGTRTTYNGLRYEIRSARVDIEITGYAPYEANTNVYIPTNLVRDVLPGSTMELRVDSTNRAMVLVVGPDVGFAQGTVQTT